MINCHSLSLSSNVKLGDDRPGYLNRVNFSALLGLRHLAINHCSLEDVSVLQGNSPTQLLSTTI